MKASPSCSCTPSSPRGAPFHPAQPSLASGAARCPVCSDSPPLLLALPSPSLPTQQRGPRPPAAGSTEGGALAQDCQSPGGPQCSVPRPGSSSAVPPPLPLPSPLVPSLALRTRCVGWVGTALRDPIPCPPSTCLPSGLCELSHPRAHDRRWQRGHPTEQEEPSSCCQEVACPMPGLAGGALLWCLTLALSYETTAGPPLSSAQLPPMAVSERSSAE